MAKKKTKPQKPVHRWKLYVKEGNALKRKNKFCPKCGPSFFMASHKDRHVCGNCHYMEKK